MMLMEGCKIPKMLLICFLFINSIVVSDSDKKIIIFFL